MTFIIIGKIMRGLTNENKKLRKVVIIMNMKKCDKCGKIDVSRGFRSIGVDIIDYHKTWIDLCSSCAAKMGLTSVLTEKLTGKEQETKAIEMIEMGIQQLIEEHAENIT